MAIGSRYSFDFDPAIEADTACVGKKSEERRLEIGSRSENDLQAAMNHRRRYLLGLNVTVLIIFATLYGTLAFSPFFIGPE
ncbi:hypothetical protein ANCDUO_16266, partial [Ancylostoma duodenale]